MHKKVTVNIVRTAAQRLFCFTILLVLASCKKESSTPQPAPTPAPTPASPPKVEVLDTIFPTNPYLPAYPGSYWVYKINGGPATSTVSVGPKYVRDSLYDRLLREYKIKKMVPLYNNIRLWCDGFYVPVGYYNIPQFWQLVRMGKRGESWSPYQSLQTYGSYEGIYMSDTSLILDGKNYDHVIVIRDYDLLPYPMNMSVYSDNYYAKDIGVIKKYTYHWRHQSWGKQFVYIPQDSIVDVYELSSYFINKK